jgi:CheY-like chemotaxis protein
MKNLLIADDEAFMRRLLQHTLGRMGVRVRLAVSGDAALAALAEEPADLLVIDVNMPGRDGFETVRFLRDDPHLAHIPVIMLTAGGLNEVRQRAAELGVAAFFTKPFGPSELVNEAKALLGIL